MADETNTKSEPMPPRFKITNVVRRVNSKVRRVLAPGRRRFKQFVCGKRLLRKQSIWITPEEMEKYKEQLFEQVREGAIIITAPDGSVLSVDAKGSLVARKGMEIHSVDAPSKEVPTKPEPTANYVEPEPPHPPPAPVDPAKEESPNPPDETPKESGPLADSKHNDLTELPGVGAGRARKLEAAGITTFKQIAEMSPGALAKILGSPVTEDQAADICDAASEKEG